MVVGKYIPETPEVVKLHLDKFEITKELDMSRKYNQLMVLLAFEFLLIGSEVLYGHYIGLKTADIEFPTYPILGKILKERLEYVRRLS